MLRKILLAAAAVPIAALGVQWGATANAAVRLHPVTYKCTTQYLRPTGPVSNHASGQPGKPNTEEAVTCTRGLTKKISFKVTGKMKVSLSEQADCYPDFTGSWFNFPQAQVASLSTVYIIPSGKTCAAWAFAEVSGTVPFSRLPKIVIS